jgi:hypothetical protein
MAIEQLRKAQTSIDEVEADEILAVIEANLGGVELIGSAAMMDLRKGEWSGQESYFRGLSGVVCGDALALIPLKAE